MRTTLATITALGATALLPMLASTASAGDMVRESQSAELTCPRGEVKVTNEDGSETCAKLTLVDPSGRGFLD